ncbi:multifunctional protein ADE2 isoform X2 [Protopterus annectens]|uniref:multifunctional protein ADE2 isoform X2 n=1 Tax=Protopterus annectens TaxID=7888 RepID=UPI001CF93341|nr:multifunctional protein ADE2 isoform X2 [Protopterus annectens]
MECGAGKHWTEEEVKALLSIWAEKSIQKQLHGATRNKGIFIYIAERLQKFGVYRDWKQCRAKYKNLKYEYRTVKYAHNSGDKNKSMKFFHQLDAILRNQSIVQLNEDEDGMCTDQATSSREQKDDKEAEILCNVNATPEHAADEISVAIEDDEDSTEDSMFSAITKAHDSDHQRSLQEHSGNVPLFPAVATEGGKHWSDDEVRALISVWSEKNIQQQLEGSIRNKGIFEQIASRLQKFGLDRDWKQCRTKYKNLKYEYKLVKSVQDSGHKWKTMKFFSELNAILGQKRSKQFSSSNSMDKVNMSWKDSKPNNDSEPDEDDDIISNASEDPFAAHIKKEVPDIDGQLSFEEPVNQFKVITVNDTGAGRHWTDEEVRSLIETWSDEKIRQQLEEATRNKEIFEQISDKLMESGIDRDWKQCRTKYKNLKYEYRALQRGNSQHGTPRRSMRFYDELDAILRRKSAAETREGRESLQSAPEIRTVTEDMDPSTRLYSRLDYSAESDEEDSRSSAEEIFISNVKRKAPAEMSFIPAKRRVSETSAAMIKLTPNPDAVRETQGMYEAPTGHCKQGDDKIINHTVQLHFNPRIQGPHTQVHQRRKDMESAVAVATGLKIGTKLSEGKTKEVYLLPDFPGHVLMQSKDQITAGNAAKKDQMEGKAALSNKTTCCVFRLLHEAGIKTAFVRKHTDTAFIAEHCEMIPIEWVCRRIATGSFLKRNPGVKEGYRFSPPKIEMFYKDDTNNDPQWSEEQIIESEMNCAGLKMGSCEVDIMSRSTLAIFEILEKAWATQNCTLVDMKIEFGVSVSTKELVLADVIDNDSWRLWPSGDRSQQKDKQVYRDLKEVTPEALQVVKRNFEWVAERVELLLEPMESGRVVVLMGSTSDLAHCEKIKKSCASYGIPCELRVTSAHKGPDETLRIKAKYEGDGKPTVFVAVAGRSNGLGPVLSGNTAYPVINCPPLTSDWGSQDVWSSLRMPSGLGCSTILSPEAAAQFAAQIFGITDHLVWAKLRSSMLNTWISLKQADKKLQECCL